MNAIVVEKLSKCYRLQRQARADTLRDALSHGARGLWRRLRSGKLEEESFWALRDLDFAVKSGEVVGIIGRNGAGKSTLLKILSRITEPTEGRVTLRGRVASLTSTVVRAAYAANEPPADAAEVVRSDADAILQALRRSASWRQRVRGIYRRD